MRLQLFPGQPGHKALLDHRVFKALPVLPDQPARLGLRVTRGRKDRLALQVLFQDRKAPLVRQGRKGLPVRPVQPAHKASKVLRVRLA